MNRKIEKEKRSLIKQKLKREERKKLLDSLPISISKLQELFDWLDLKLTADNCDNSLRFTLDFIQKNQFPENEIIEWLKTNGGYCDCEVLANVEDQTQ